MKKVFLSDIDGTLIKTNNPVHENVVAAIKDFTAQGGRFSLCTGRAASAVYPIAKSVDVNLPCILLGGALIYDFSTQSTIWKQPLRPEWRKLVTAIYENEPLSGITVCTDTQILSLRKDKRLLEHGVAEDRDAPTCGLNDINGEVFKILITHEDIAAFARIAERYVDSSIFHFCPASRHFYEITDINVNKGFAAKKLLEVCGLSDYLLYAAGDGGTDLLLKDAADFFFVPETAQQHVKNNADFIFPPPSDGGLALAIEKVMKQ